jgi:hypothetical protein
MALPGNKHGLALKDPIIRQKAYESLCNHIAKGKSIRSWWYEDDNCSCTWETMYKYIKDTNEFDSIKKEIAHCKGLALWETIVEEAGIGKNDKANVACLQMIMRNKFGWDKDESKSSNTHYTIKVDCDGIATGVSTENLSTSNNKGTQ